MGMIRWTAKGLKLAGDILDSDDVEAWIMAKGQALVERRLTSLPAKWLAGQTRAKRQLRAEILGRVNRDEILRGALERSIAELPLLVEKAARDVVTRGPAAGHESNTYFSLALCPREVILRRHMDQLLESFKESRLLQEYEALPELFLSRTAGDSEESYFSWASQHGADIGARCRVVGTNRDFEWNMGATNGHYYVGFLRSTFGSGRDLTNRGTNKDFKAFVEGAKPKLDGVLARLDAESMTSISDGMSDLTR